MKPEIWKPITGYEGLYEISSHGRLKSTHKSNRRKLSGGLMNLQSYKIHNRPHKGYVVCTLYKGGVKKQTSIHQLVAIHFVENPHNYPMVNHNDGIKSNNYYENLIWCSDVQNKEHAAINNLMAVGVRNGMSKLTEKQVLEIRQKYSNKISPTELSKKYGVCKQQIHAIVKYKVWKKLA